MPDSKPEIIRHIPTVGLNVYEEETLLPPTVLTTAENILVDKRSITVRQGCPAQASGDHPVFAIKGGANITTLYSLHVCHWDADDSVRTTFMVGATATGTIGLFYFLKEGVGETNAWVELTPPTGVTLAAERGEFVQYMNSVYYSAPSVPTLRIRRLPNGTFQVSKAGTPSPDDTVLIDLWDSVTITPTPTPPASTPAVKGEWDTTGGLIPENATNITLYSVGDGGVTLRHETPEETVYVDYTLDLEDPFDLTQAGDSNSKDLISFLVHRWYKNSIDQISISLLTATGVWTCPFGGRWLEDTDVYETSGEDPDPNQLDGITTSNSPIEGFATNNSIIKQWLNISADFYTFTINLRKGWFAKTSGTGSLEAITGVRITITTSAYCSAVLPAAVTLNYLTMRKSYPTPTLLGKSICDFEADEADEWSGAFTSLSTDYAYRGVRSLKFALDGTNQTATAIRTIAGTPINVRDQADGYIIGARDKLHFAVAVKYTGKITGTLGTTPPITLTIILTDDDDITATSTYWLGGLSFMGKRKSRAGFYRVNKDRLLMTGPMSYSTGTFKTFKWEAIKKVTITATLNSISAGKSADVYIDALRIEQGKYTKYIASFTPGIVDALALASDYTDTVLHSYPIASWVIDKSGDFLHNRTYNLQGAGYMEMPNFAHSEKGRGSLASLLISAGASAENAPYGLANAFNAQVEGCRVTLPNYKRLWFSGGFDTKLDLSKYWTWTWGSEATVSPPITDEDWVRCWVWISNPRYLQKIIFRLYTSDSSSSGPVRIFSPNDNAAHSSYYEYEWSPYELIDEKLYEAKMQTRQVEAIEKGMNLNSLMQNTMSKGDLNPENLSELPPELAYLADKVDINKAAKVAQFLGVTDEITNMLGGKSDSKDGINHVIRWQRKQFIHKNSLTADDSILDWTSITGVSFEVVPKAGETVQVAFDNYYIHTHGGLTGKYSYCTTFVDSNGQESKPSVPSDPIDVENTKITVENLPSSWPFDIDQLRIYRLGGSKPDWALVGLIGKDTGRTDFIDRVPDEKVGPLLQTFGDGAPKAEHMVLMGDRMIYANLEDALYQSHPSRVYISEPFRPGRCQLETMRDLSPNDGSEITGLAVFSGYLCAFKEMSCWSMDGQDFFPIKRNGKVGCIAPRSIAVCETAVIFLSHEGPAFFNIGDVSSMPGRPVLPRFEAESSLSNAVGFIHGDYYHIFYGSDNSKCLILHLPTMSWVEAQYKLTSSTYCTVTDFGKDQPENLTFLGLTTGQVLDFQTAENDCGQTIVATFQTVNSTLDSGEMVKNPKVFYLRGKSLWEGTGNTSVVITPYVEQIVASSAGAAYTHTISTLSKTVHSTHSLVNQLTTGGFTYGVKAVITGRATLSMLTSILDVLPLQRK